MKFYNFAFTVFLTTFVPSLHGQATSSTSSTKDVGVKSTVTGQYRFSTVTGNLSAGPLTSALGTAPQPYNFVPSRGTAGSDSSGLLSISRSADLRYLNAFSDVTGTAETGSVDSRGEIARIGTLLELNLGLPSKVQLLGVTLDPSGPDLFIASTSVSWDGSDFRPVATSNLLTTGLVTIKVLGQNLSFAGLTAGVASIINVNVSQGSPLDLTTVTGTITLTPDIMSTSIAAGTSSANATSLLVGSNLRLTAPGGIDLDVNSTMTFNQSTSTLRATAVPEPAALGSLLLATGLMSLRRRRTPHTHFN